MEIIHNLTLPNETGIVLHLTRSGKHYTEMLLHEYRLAKNSCRELLRSHGVLLNQAVIALERQSALLNTVADYSTLSPLSPYIAIVDQRGHEFLAILQHYHINFSSAQE